MKEDVADEGVAGTLAREALGSNITKQREVVLTRALTSLSLWVEGIYWYMDRTPPASKHTRVRAFFDESGKLACPKCEYVLCEDFNEYTEEPVEFSKTLNNPRFICPHCNSYVQVSSKSEAYKEAQEKAREERKKKSDPSSD